MARGSSSDTASPVGGPRGRPRKSTSTKCATRHSLATACCTYVSSVCGCARMNSISVACLTLTSRAPSSWVMQLTPLGALSSTSMSPTDSPSLSMLVRNGGPSGAFVFFVPRTFRSFSFFSFFFPSEPVDSSSSPSPSSAWFSCR